MPPKKNMKNKLTNEAKRAALNKDRNPDISNPFQVLDEQSTDGEGKMQEGSNGKAEAKPKEHKPETRVCKAQTNKPEVVKTAESSCKTLAHVSSQADITDDTRQGPTQVPIKVSDAGNENRKIIKETQTQEFTTPGRERILRNPQGFLNTMKSLRECKGEPELTDQEKEFLTNPEIHPNNVLRRFPELSTVGLDFTDQYLEYSNDDDIIKQLEETKKESDINTEILDSERLNRSQKTSQSRKATSFEMAMKQNMRNKNKGYRLFSNEKETQNKPASQANIAKSCNYDSDGDMIPYLMDSDEDESDTEESITEPKNSSEAEKELGTYTMTRSCNLKNTSNNNIFADKNDFNTGNHVMLQGGQGQECVTPRFDRTSFNDADKQQVVLDTPVRNVGKSNENKDMQYTYNTLLDRSYEQNSNVVKANDNVSGNKSESSEKHLKKVYVYRDGVNHTQPKLPMRTQHDQGEYSQDTDVDEEEPCSDDTYYNEYLKNQRNKYACQPYIAYKRAKQLQVTAAEKQNELRFERREPWRYGQICRKGQEVSFSEQFKAREHDSRVYDIKNPEWVKHSQKNFDRATVLRTSCEEEPDVEECSFPYDGRYNYSVNLADIRDTGAIDDIRLTTRLSLAHTEDSPRHASQITESNVTNNEDSVGASRESMYHQSNNNNQHSNIENAYYERNQTRMHKGYDTCSTSQEIPVVQPFAYHARNPHDQGEMFPTYIKREAFLEASKPLGGALLPPKRNERAPASDIEMLSRGSIRNFSLQEMDKYSFAKDLDKTDRAELLAEEIARLKEPKEIEELVESRSSVLPIRTLVGEAQEDATRYWYDKFNTAHWVWGHPVVVPEFAAQEYRHLHPFYAELYSINLTKEEEYEREVFRQRVMNELLQRVERAITRCDPNMSLRGSKQLHSLKDRAMKWINARLTRGMLQSEYWLVLAKDVWVSYEKECAEEKRHVENFVHRHEKSVRNAKQHLEQLVDNYWDELTELYLVETGTFPDIRTAKTTLEDWLFSRNNGSEYWMQKLEQIHLAQARVDDLSSTKQDRLYSSLKRRGSENWIAKAENSDRKEVENKQSLIQDRYHDEARLKQADAYRLTQRTASGSNVRIPAAMYKMGGTTYTTNLSKTEHLHRGPEPENENQDHFRHMVKNSKQSGESLTTKREPTSTGHWVPNVVSSNGSVHSYKWANDIESDLGVNNESVSHSAQGFQVPTLPNLFDLPVREALSIMQNGMQNANSVENTSSRGETSDVYTTPKQNKAVSNTGQRRGARYSRTIPDGDDDGSSSSSSSSDSTSSYDTSSSDSESDLSRRSSSSSSGSIRSRDSKGKRKRNRNKHNEHHRKFHRQDKDDDDRDKGHDTKRKARYHNGIISPNPERSSKGRGSTSRGRSGTSASTATTSERRSGITRSNYDDDDLQQRKENICGPYVALTKLHDHNEARDRRTGRSRKTPDLQRFRELRLNDLELLSVVKFLNAYEDCRGNHPDLVFKMTAFLSEKAKTELAIEAARLGWDLSSLPGNSISHLDDTDIRTLLHKKVAAKSKDDFIHKISSIPFDEDKTHDPHDFDAYNIGKLLNHGMRFAINFRTIAETIAVEADPNSIPFLDRKENVKGIKDIFLDSFPQAVKGYKTTGRLLYEKSAYSNTTLKTKRVLRDWIQEFFRCILPYKDIQQHADDLNGILLRADLVGKTISVSSTPPPKSEKQGTPFQRRNDGKLHHVTFDMPDETSLEEVLESEAVDSPVLFDNSIPDNISEYMAAIAEQKVNGCHKKFQFGKCTDTACKLDHTSDGMRRLYLKRIWELAKAHNRPDSEAVLRNIKHALDEIDSQQPKASDKNE